MPAGLFTDPSVATDDCADLIKSPHTVIIFGAHRLPVAIETVICETDDQAMHLARALAASHPESYGYEMWFNGRKLAAYFSQTALGQNGHTHEPPTLRHY